MRDQTRVIATMIIWVALSLMIGIIAVTLIVTHTELDFWGGVFLLILIATLGESATKGTKAIWGAAYSDDEDEVRLTKAKRTRQDRVERLVESLDDDEIYDLEALLLAQHEHQRG